MTGQVIAVSLLVALVVAPWLLLRGRRAVRRRRAERLLKRLGIEVVQSPLIPPGMVYLTPKLPPLEPDSPLLRLSPELDLDFERMKWRYMAEERMKLTIPPPGSTFKITDAP